ncbi:MAG: ABC transporter ATP-binding protein [Candidatus Sumerlaeaceae bacterium]|nr:ABC transporter ATP-binding protein [Candidatus Sumerlaeaceae bacterium]
MIKCDCEHRARCSCPNGVVCAKHLAFQRNGTPVLYDITFCLDEGVFLGVIGPNGGGKTTLLELIVGLLPVTSGHLEVFKTPPAELGAKRSLIGYVPQRHRIDPNFPVTALDVVLMGAARLAGLGRRYPAEVKRRAHELLERVGVGELTNRPIGQMSGGQQQRVFLARALITAPRLLILDEPTSGVDSMGQQQFLHLVRTLRDELGLTVIMVSHDVAQLSYYADQIACLNRTLHWHDKASLLTERVVRDVYKCELDAYVERVREIGEEA